MKVLLTGATGFIGSNLLRMLLSDGHDVVVLKRSSSNMSRISNFIAEVAQYDLDLVSLDSILQLESDIDMIIHAATNYGRKQESVWELISSNVLFPARLMELFAALKRGVFINTDTALGKFVSQYALSKKQLRDWGQMLSSQQLLRFINVKLEHTYGPFDDASKFTSFIVRECTSNAPFLELTEGHQMRDFIYIDDVISAYRTIINSDHSMPYIEYELGSGTAVSIRSFVQTVHRITGSHTKLRFGAKPYRQHEAMRSQADISKLIKLGWHPEVGLEEGIRRIVGSEYGPRKKLHRETP